MNTILGRWTLSGARLNAQLPVTIPGSIMSALVLHGIVPDPRLGFAERDVQWVGESAWSMCCAFELEPDMLEHEVVELCLDGIDTIGTVVVNGHAVGQSASQHLPLRYAVRQLLVVGENIVEVRFESAVAWARAEMERLGPLPWIPWTEAPMPWNFVRKMACNFGWDWGPTVVDAGLWRPVRVEAWNVVRIAGLRPQVVSADDAQATVDVHLDLAWASDLAEACDLECVLRAPNGDEVVRHHQRVAPSTSTLSIPLQVTSPALWWPAGYGEQPLYELEVRVGPVVRMYAIGLRHIVLDTSEDAPGARFVLRINGREVFCKGANWIPDDIFVAAVDAERYAHRIQQAMEANHNMLRVWGGGIFEADAFYDACDRLGVLVWQDFPFACALYPEEPPFPELVRAEARAQVTRLAHHPSLVLWNGCNENFWGHQDWGRPRWSEQAGERGWGAGYYLDVLPAVVSELAPETPYWPGSPYSNADQHPLHDDFGTRHVWDAWNDRPSEAYHDYRPRFSAEFGFQGPANWATLEAAIGPQFAELGPDSPELVHRQRALDGTQKMWARLRDEFDVCDSVDIGRWHYLAQLNQARSLSRGLTWFRSLQPHCMGALYWQLNDCWPAISWSTIDSAARRKPAWHLAQRAFAPRLVSIEPALTRPDPGVPHGTSPRPEWNATHSLDVVLFNDSDQVWATNVSVFRTSLQGHERARQDAQVQVPARGVLRVPLREDVAMPEDPSAELLMAQVPGPPSRGRQPWDRAVHWFVPFKSMALPMARWTADVEQVDGATWRATFCAQSLVAEMIVVADRHDPAAVVSRQVFTLLPGESISVDIRSKGQWGANLLLGAPLARCVNQSSDGLLDATQPVVFEEQE